MPATARFPRVATLKTAVMFRAHLDANGIRLPFDETLAPAGSSPLAAPLTVNGVRVGNTVVYIPVGPMGVPLAGTLNLPAQPKKE